jgi:lipopolysaccharide export system permease protein
MFLGITLLVIVFTGYTFAIKLSEAADGLIPLSVVARLIGLKSVITLEVLLPTALYLSIIAALSRLHRDSEMAAINAAGVGEARILRSVIILSVVIAVIVGAISLFARPWAYRQSYQIEAEARAEFDIRKIEPGQFIELQGSKYVLFARQVDKNKGRLRDVFLQSDRGNKIQLIFAQEAFLPPVRAGERRGFEFVNGYNYLLDQRGRQDTTLKFKHMTVYIPADKRDTKYRRRAEPSINLYRSDAPKDIAEFQWRLSTPLATVLLSLLAVPLSRSAPRQGRYHSFLFAILAYVGLFNLTGVARTWVEDGKVPSFPGIWWIYLVPLLLFVGLMVAPTWLRRKR